jgi:hypothetical protein
MKPSLFATAVSCLVICAGCGRNNHPVTIAGNVSSYEKTTGYEFNYASAGYGKAPEIIVFCRVRVADKPVPCFTHKITSRESSSYEVIINGTPITPPADRFVLYVNDKNGNPKEIEIERAEAIRILKADHEEYIKIWNEHVEPKLGES